MELNASQKITDSLASAQMDLTGMLTLNARESQDVDQTVSALVLKPVLMVNALLHANVESMQNALSKITKHHVNVPLDTLEALLKSAVHLLILAIPIHAELMPFVNWIVATRSATVRKE